MVFKSWQSAKMLNFKKALWGASLAVQCLRLRASTAGGAGSIPGQGTKIPHAAWHGQPPKKRHYVKLKRQDKCSAFLLLDKIKMKCP